MNQTSWLLLLYSLPAHRNTQRVAVWRRFKKIGALQIKTSTYLLPDQPAQYEHFQWLAKQIRDYGGDATLVRAQEIEGMPNEKLVALFNRARDQDYRRTEKRLQAFLARRKKIDAERRARTERGSAVSRRSGRSISSTVPMGMMSRFFCNAPRDLTPEQRLDRN